MLIVMKFGGSSLADEERIRAAARRIAGECAQGNRVVAVVSAQADQTDRMLEKLDSLAAVRPPRETDACLAACEQISAGLMAAALAQLDCRAVSLTGWQAGIATDGCSGDARILGLRSDRITRELESGNAVVVAGFQGVDAHENITTLGRGGSDTTAVALAAFLQADQCRIYTDVDGVYDKDPRLYADASRFETIGYDAMLRLARGGAQVLHDRCVEMAQRCGVQIRVLSSFRPGQGTLVCDTTQ